MAALGNKQDSAAAPMSAVNIASTSYLESALDHRPRGSQEKAHMWRHPELTGVELFRGVYKR